LTVCGKLYICNGSGGVFSSKSSFPTICIRFAQPLHDIRVRKALNYAINKEELLRYAFKGNAVQMRGDVTEKSGVDVSDTEPYEWNIPKARQLLKEMKAN